MDHHHNIRILVNIIYSIPGARILVCGCGRRTIQLAFQIPAQKKEIRHISRNLHLLFRRLIYVKHKQDTKQVEPTMYRTAKHYFLRPDHEILGFKLPNKTAHAHASLVSGEVVTEYDLVALQNSRGNEVNAACTARRKIASLAVEDPEVFRSLQQELRSRRVVTHSAVASVLSEVLNSAGEDLMTKTPRVREVNVRSSTSRKTSQARQSSTTGLVIERISSGCGVGVASSGEMVRSKSDILQLPGISGSGDRHPRRSSVGARLMGVAVGFPWMQQGEEPSDSQEDEELMWKRRQKMRMAQQPSMRTAKALNMAWKYLEEIPQSSLSPAELQSSASKNHEQTTEEMESDQDAMLTCRPKMLSTLGGSSTSEENQAEGGDSDLLVEFPVWRSQRQ
jgi:hypothetical protein